MELKGEGSAHLAVAADPNRGQQGGEGGEDPPRRHDDTRVSQAKFAVEPQSVFDGVPALQGDRCQCEHWQLTGENLHGRTNTHISSVRAAFLSWFIHVEPHTHTHTHTPWRSLRLCSPGPSASLWRGYSTAHGWLCLQSLWRPGRCPCRGQKRPSGTWGNGEQSVCSGCLWNRWIDVR